MSSRDREIVSPAMAKELDERVEQAGGDIAIVRHQLEDDLHALEAHETTDDLVQVALILSEIEYLDKKAQDAMQAVEEKHEGLADRIRHMFHSGA